MIFITVGTHEQGMDRLFKRIDELIETGQIKRQVFAQIGYTKYTPKHFKFERLINFNQMDELVKDSYIVITHGGPGSIFHCLQYGKIPVVVPRNPIFNEHVDDHQILFTKRLELENKILAVYDIDELFNTVDNYKEKSDKFSISQNNTNNFIKKMDNLISKKFNL